MNERKNITTCENFCEMNEYTPTDHILLELSWDVVEFCEMNEDTPTDHISS